MSNELLFILLLVFSLSLPLIAYWMGRTWVYVFVAINACILLPLMPLSSTVFGYALSLGVIYYASLFLAQIY